MHTHPRSAVTFLVFCLLLAGCSQPGVTPTPAPPGGILPTLEIPQPAALLEPGKAPDTYWVTNPASGARLFVRVFSPPGWNGSDLLPALVLMPGGIGRSDPGSANHLAGSGFLVVTFDADGRGKSQGVEDYNGFITQDGLAAVIKAALQLPGLDEERFGAVSYSYGVTAISGALARHPDLPIDFFIDWEGPVDRFYTTSNCQPETHGITWQPCPDDAWWSQREAIAFIGDVQVPYQRLQSQSDHVQPDNDHALEIINAAVAGGVPWVRLNENSPNQLYDLTAPPAMIPDAQDGRVDALVAEVARYILENVLPSMP